MNLENGTRRMELNPQDICRILQACAKTKVKEFKLGDFSVSFEEKPGIKPVESPTLITGSAESVEQESIARDEVDIRERQMAEMLIEDPLMYEKLLEQGELEDAKQENSGS